MNVEGGVLPAFLTALLTLCAWRWLAAAPPRRPPGAPEDGAARHRPSLAAWRRAAQTRRSTDAALAALLEEMASGLRSGASLRTALREVANSASPAAMELRAVVARVDRGATLAEALDHWRRATEHPAARLVATALVHAAVLGGADPKPLEAVAGTLRERVALRGELRTQAAQARASAAVLSALPPAFLVVVAAVDADVADVITHTPLGWSCLAAGALLDGVGALWMARIVAGAGP
jgi:tight adherence protein B